jgi:hypothetical protein
MRHPHKLKNGVFNLLSKEDGAGGCLSRSSKIIIGGLPPAKFSTSFMVRFYSTSLERRRHKVLKTNKIF